MPKLQKTIERKVIAVPANNRKIFPAIIEANGRNIVTDLEFDSYKLAKRVFGNALIQWPALSKKFKDVTTCYTSQDSPQ